MELLVHKDLNKLALSVNFWNNIVIVGNHGRTYPKSLGEISQKEPHTKKFEASSNKSMGMETKTKRARPWADIHGQVNQKKSDIVQQIKKS